MEKILKDREDEVILQALHADPTLKACMLEMIGITDTVQLKPLLRSLHF